MFFCIHLLGVSVVTTNYVHDLCKCLFVHACEEFVLVFYGK